MFCFVFFLWKIISFSTLKKVTFFKLFLFNFVSLAWACWFFFNSTPNDQFRLSQFACCQHCSISFVKTESKQDRKSSLLGFETTVEELWNRLPKKIPNRCDIWTRWHTEPIRTKSYRILVECRRWPFSSHSIVSIVFVTFSSSLLSFHFSSLFFFFLPFIYFCSRNTCWFSERIVLACVCVSI